MQTTQQLSKSGRGVKGHIQTFSLCAIGASCLAGLSITPQAQHFSSLYLDSLKYSFCSKPPAFESLQDFVHSLQADRSTKGFGEIENMQAVRYHSISKAPLNVENFSRPVNFLIKGNLVGKGETQDGHYFFDLADDKSPQVRIISDSILLREWSHGNHKAEITFIQSEDKDKGIPVTVVVPQGSFAMSIDNARLEY